MNYIENATPIADAFGAPVTNPAQSEEQFKYDINKDVEDNVRSHPKQLLSAIEELDIKSKFFGGELEGLAALLLEHGEDLGNLWTFVTGLRYQITEIERILKKHWGDQTEQWRDANE